MFKSWKTSALGAISLIISALILTGVLDNGDQDTAKTMAESIVESLDAIFFAVTGLIGLFSRDNDVTSEETGATEAARQRALNRRR